MNLQTISPVKLQKAKGLARGLPDHGIYIECLASRNSLELHGHWIDLTKCDSPEDICHCIEVILATSPAPGAEEWEITDWTIPSTVAQTQSPASIMQWMEVRNSFHFWEEQQAYDEWVNAKNWIHTRDAWDQAFQGFYADETDFAITRAEEQGLEIGHYSDYLDWERIYDAEYNCNGFTSYPVVLERKDALGNPIHQIAVFAPY